MTIAHSSLVRCAALLCACFLSLVTGCQRWSTFETAYPVPEKPLVHVGNSLQAVAAGTPIDVELTGTLTSEDGPQRARAFVTRTALLSIDGSVIAPAGSPVTVRVHARPRRGLGRAGELIVETLAIITPEGNQVAISGRARAHGDSREYLAVGPAPAIPERLWIVNLFRMFIRGGRAELPIGLIIPAVVAG